MLVYGLLLIGGGIGVLVYFRHEFGIRPAGPAGAPPARAVLRRWLRLAVGVIGLTVEPARPPGPARRPPAIGRAAVPRPPRVTGRAAVPPPRRPDRPAGSGREPPSPGRAE